MTILEEGINVPPVSWMLRQTATIIFVYLAVMQDMRKPDSHLLSRTLRARDNGAADKHPPVAWRSAPHNQRMKPTPGEKACGFLARRGLSAAPLEVANERLTTLCNSTIVL